MIRIGALVRVKTVHSVLTGWQGYGELNPSFCYYNLQWTRLTWGVTIPVSDPEGLLMGMVVKRKDARVFGEIPDCYSHHKRWDIYQVLLVQDEPPLWFRWDELTLLENEDEAQDREDIPDD